MNKHIKSFRYMAAGTLCMIGVFLAAKTDESSSEQALSDKVLAEKHLEDRGFQIPERDNNLPNVLLYGDSITGHYYPYVATALKGEANVYTMPPHEDWDSSNLIPYMTEAKEAMEQKGGIQWDIIHFNFGLHDMKRYNDDGKKDREHGTMQVDYQNYAKNLEASIRWLQAYAPEAQFIFATTTPVPEGEPRRRVEDSIKLNEIARTVIAKFPKVIVNDLYAFTLPHHLEWKRESHDVHYNETGKEAQGGKVAAAILEALKKRKL